MTTDGPPITSWINMSGMRDANPTLGDWPTVGAPSSEPEASLLFTPNWFQLVCCRHPLIHAPTTDPAIHHKTYTSSPCFPVTLASQAFLHGSLSSCLLPFGHASSKLYTFQAKGAAKQTMPTCSILCLATATDICMRANSEEHGEVEPGTDFSLRELRKQSAVKVCRRSLTASSPGFTTEGFKTADLRRCRICWRFALLHLRPVRPPWRQMLCKRAIAVHALVGSPHLGEITQNLPQNLLE